MDIEKSDMGLDLLCSFHWMAFWTDANKLLSDGGQILWLPGLYLTFRWSGVAMRFPRADWTDSVAQIESLSLSGG